MADDVRLTDRVIKLLEREAWLGQLHWASSIAASLGVTTRTAACALAYLKHRDRVESYPCRNAPRVYRLSDSETERYLKELFGMTQSSRRRPEVVP